MANQPKKYKKFVATAATATLVASAIVPVASAAGFTDVANNSHEEAINALADAGIINGYADGTFKPNQTINRGQVVKLLGRWLETEGFEAPADWDTKQRFNDLPLTAEKELVKYAALAKDAGVFAGSNGNLNHTQTMQRQQMAVVLVRAINEIYELDLVKEYKAAKFTSEISDLDKAFSAEQREAITALEYAELTNAANLPGKAFNPANSITRGQFASFLYRTINLDVQTKASVKAINNTTVEVTFDEEVDNVQALKFEIKDLEVKNAAVKQTNKKVVVLTTAPQTADKEYTVSLAGEEIGKFKGVNAVIPTKVDLVEKSTQGKLGQQVTLKAQVTVAEGQNKAGIPVTFFIPGSANGVKAPVTVEAVTNEEGIATYSYTRYAATNDTVTVYANGDRSKFSTGYVFWAVDQTLTIKEVNEGSSVNNGANKIYKVTYKDPDTGKPVSGKTLNVSVKENIDVTVDKLQNVTVNGVKVAQTSNSNTTAAQITTDSNGEATFTVTGSNAEVTPVVFTGEAVSGQTAPAQKYNADALQATAAKVKFGATQADYTLEVTRDGGEEAATTYKNGRKYKVVVKTKDGKLAANETVNVAFNEDIDGVISTTTDAKFVKVDDDKQVGWETKYNNDAKAIIVKTDSKGEATFVVGNDKVNSYATPVVWIDVNYQSGKTGTLDKGEPTAIAPISYFQAPTINGAKLVAKDKNGEETSKYVGKNPAKFEVVLVNQSGKTEKDSKYTTNEVSYSIENTGANEVLVEYTYDKEPRTITVGSNRVNSVIADNGTINVTAVDGKSTSVKVSATGVAKKIEDGKVVKEFSFHSKDATATFTSTSEVTNLFTGTVKSFNTDKKTIVFNDKDGDKDAVKYAGESGKKYVYKNVNGAPLSETQFIELLDGATKGVKVTYEVKDDVVTFYVLSVDADATPPQDAIVADAAKALKDAIDGVKVSDYVEPAKAQAAVDAAKKVLDDTKSTTQQLKDAKTALETAVKDLPKVDQDNKAAKDALDAAIKAVNKDEYISSDVAKAETALTTAKAVLAKPTATTQELKDAKTTLETELAKLTKKALVDLTKVTFDNGTVDTVKTNELTLTFTSTVPGFKFEATSLNVTDTDGTIATVANGTTDGSLVLKVANKDLQPVDLTAGITNVFTFETKVIGTDAKTTPAKVTVKYEAGKWVATVVTP